jgi:hypothetical protein
LANSASQWQTQVFIELADLVILNKSDLDHTDNEIMAGLVIFCFLYRKLITLSSVGNSEFYLRELSLGLPKLLKYLLFLVSVKVFRLSEPFQGCNYDSFESFLICSNI